MVQPNVISISEASKEKDCSRQALYNAIERGDLNTVQMGRYKLIVRDDLFRVYQVKETGGRTHKSYLDKPGREDD